MSYSRFADEPSFRSERSPQELEQLEKAFLAQRRSYRRLGFSTERIDQNLAVIRLARADRHIAAPAPLLGRLIVMGRSLLPGGSRQSIA